MSDRCVSITGLNGGPGSGTLEYEGITAVSSTSALPIAFKEVCCVSAYVVHVNFGFEISDTIKII